MPTDRPVVSPASDGASGPPDPTRIGLVYDVDGVLRIAPLPRQIVRLWALLTADPRDRRSLLGMPRLVRVLADEDRRIAVFYLTALPVRLARPLGRLLRRDGYPAGATLMTGRALVSGWLLGIGSSRKRAALDRLARHHPHRRWVLIGDDAGHDPQLFEGFRRDHTDRVAAVAVRRVIGRVRPDDDQTSHGRDGDGIAVVEAPNGEEMLPRLAAALGLDGSRGRRRGPPAVDDWFLTPSERGNPATRLRAWTTGNAVRRQVHGEAYFRALAECLATTTAGDVVLVVGWRGDAVQKLADDGPTVAEALVAAAARGVRVRGLLWRSHLAWLGYHLRRNRELAADVWAAGGEVLLDQRVRAIGSHHQKMVVIRHEGRPDDDVAFVGGIDLDLGSRDGIAHRGDPQSAASQDEYARSPRHDAQVELRGPAVEDLRETFRERWDDPAPLARLPWHVIPDRLHRLLRGGSPLPDPAPDPPVVGTCAVQVLRTYPRRRPRHPFAPRGERSVARSYIKALSRAQRLVYVEDQYLWSADVARIFAAALRRSPQLQLIAVAPRPEQQAALDPSMIGHSEALTMVHDAGGDRVQILDVENEQGRAVYVHSKVCVIDDVWACVGSNNLNTRSWTHDSELTVAVLDEQRDPRLPTDPGGLGDGARLFARDLRLELMREHLGLADDTELLDPDRAADIVRHRALALDTWHTDGATGSRPPGRLRRHAPGHEQVQRSRRHRWITGPAYRMLLDPDGRPLLMRLRRSY